MPDGKKPGEEFNRKLSEWEERSQAYQEHFKTTQQQLATYQKQLEANPVVPMPEIMAKAGGQFNPLLYILPHLPWQPPTPRQIAKDLRPKIEAVSAEMIKDDFFARLYSEVPFAVAETRDKSGAIIPPSIGSVDEVLSILKPPDNLTSEELSTVEDTIADMIATLSLDTEPTEPKPPGEIEYPELVAPTPLKRFPITIHRLSTQEIVKALTIPKPPESAASEEEWEEFLRAKGYTDEDIDKEQQITAEELIASWTDRNSQIEAYKASLAEMPEYKLIDRLKEMTVQPGLAALGTAMLYFQHVSMPLAGKLYKNFIPDIEAEYQRYKLIYPDAPATGPDSALTHAWESWDAPFEGTAEWILKYMIMEGLVDPMTYVGLGIATKLTKPLPYIGRLVGAAEGGMAAVLEVPFDALKYGLGRLPKTITQRAALATRQSSQYIERHMTKYTGKPLSRIGMKDFTEAAEAAINYALKNPQSEDSIALAGREMLKHTPVDEALTKDWAGRLGTTLTPDDITKVTVENLDNVFEDMFTRKLITPREAAGQVLRILNVEDMSKETLAIAQRILNSRAAAIKQGALAFTKAKSPLKAMKSVASRNFRTHITIERSIAALSRKEAGPLTTLLYDIELPLQAIWRNGIDRWVVRPFAEAYLTFGMYGPMNVVEDYIRSALGGVIPRRMTDEAWEEISIGLIVDPETHRYGMSEMIGALAREGPEANWNNWILQLAAFGKKGWADKIYTGLVRLPGAYGMDVRRNFVAKRYLQLLAEAGGEEFKAIVKAGPRNLPKLANRKMVKELKAVVYRLKTTGNPDTVRGAKALFTHKRIVRNEVNNVLKEHPELPNSARDHILKAFDDGVIFREGSKSIDGAVSEARTIILDDFVRGPEVATQQYHQLADLLTSLEVKNPQELASAIQAVYKMSEVYGALPEQIIAQATVRSRGLPVAERRATFDADFDRVYQFLDAAGADIDRVIAKIKLDIPRLASKRYEGAGTRLFDVMATKREYATEFRAQNMASRHDIFAGVSQKDLTSEFWDDFYLQMTNDYRIFNTKMAELDGQIVRAVEEMNVAAGARVTPRAPLVINDRPLAPQDIATLLGVRGDDISRGLLDVLTVQNNKDFFISYVQAMTRPGDVGFTKESIGAVYDQIAYSLKVSPESMSWITSKQLQLDSVRKELHSIYNSKMLPDEDVAAIGKYIDESADAVEKLMYTNKVLKPEYTNYDSVRQSAMDDAHKWYYKEFVDYSNANAFDAMMKTIYPYWSVSEDTEVMSREGWKHYWELGDADELLSFDKDTELTYWDKIQYVNVYDYDGEAIWLYDQGRDFVCTPNHWWLVKREHHDNWEFVEADRLYSRMRFPKAASHYFDGDSLLTPDEAAIIGWLVTDGTIRNVGYMAIQQSKQPQTDTIRQLVTRAGALSKESIDTLGTHVFSINREWKQRIDQLFTRYDLSYVVSHLSAEAADAMWDAMWQAEDCNRTNCFVQKEGAVLNAFELLSFLTGRFVAKHKHNGEQDSRNIWQLYIHKTKYQCNKDLLIDRVPYKGKMWCPRVEHRTILIRRNNKVCWTGNTYESQRWFWLPRSFVRHPGAFTSFERWQDNTDYGYIHISGTSIDVNPFRGTVFGSLTTRLTRRDYPEYYDSLGAAKGMVEFNDYLTRFGFYPGVHISAPLALLGGLEPQMGETMPAIWKTPLNALIAAFPKSDSVKWLSEHLFSDRFRDYMTIIEVNKRDYNGSHIWTKIKEGVALTEEEQSIWDSSRGEAALYGMGFEQFGLFRLRTDEQYRAYEESSAVIEEMTGYTPEQQDWLRRHGYRLWDMVGGISPTNQAILQELDSYKWLGSVTPLLPSRQQLELRKLDLDWDSITTYAEANQTKKLQLQQDFLSGKLGPDSYNDRLRALYAEQRVYIDGKMEDNPNLTLEGRKDYYKKYGIAVPVQHPMKELLNLYFGIELNAEAIDPETGEIFTDWNSFFAQRQAIEDAVPGELKGEWDAYMSRNSTRIELIRRDTYDNYFRKYYDVWEASLTLYPEDEQKLINEFLYLERTGQNLDRQDEIKAMMSTKTGNQLISSLRSDVSDNRASLRYANPHLDAWLFYWGRTTSFKTPQAEAIYRQICKDTGRSIE